MPLFMPMLCPKNKQKLITTLLSSYHSTHSTFSELFLLSGFLWKTKGTFLGKRSSYLIEHPHWKNCTSGFRCLEQLLHVEKKQVLLSYCCSCLLLVIRLKGVAFFNRSTFLIKIMLISKLAPAGIPCFSLRIEGARVSIFITSALTWKDISK